MTKETKEMLMKVFSTQKLKGTKNDPEEIKNYRPIANLKFFAKIVEKVAALQLQEYLKNCNLHAKSQSGYRSFHRVETAMVRVSNDILMSLDKGEAVCHNPFGFLISI